MQDIIMTCALYVLFVYKMYKISYHVLISKLTISLNGIIPYCIQEYDSTGKGLHVSLYGLFLFINKTE